jgi:SAM-dependent methyltransferase
MEAKKMTLDEMHSYWRDRTFFGENGIFRYLKGRKKSAYLVALIKKIVFPKNGSILELGCNTGRNLNELHSAGFFNLTGIDINPKSIENAKENFPHLKKLIVRSIELFFAKPRQYDLIFSMAVLEHLHAESASVFKQIAQSSKKYIITIEWEGESKNPRIIQRNYKKIFEKQGFEQIFCQEISKIKSLNGYYARIFIKKSV